MRARLSIASNPFMWAGTFLFLSLVVVAIIFWKSHVHKDESALAAYTAVYGNFLSASQAQKLESQLVENPNDLAARTKLLGYYSLKRYHDPLARAAYERHILWIIRNRPDAAIAGTSFTALDPRLNQTAYPEAKSLWLTQVKSSRPT